MTAAFIHVVMRINRLEEPGETPAEPVEAHFIQMVADSRAGVLAKMPSNRAYVFYVKMITLYGSERVAEFPGVNARIQVEEPRATPRNKRRLPRETVEPKSGWKEAAIAWEVCASLHRRYGGRDPLFKTRQADYVKHAADARQKLGTPDEPL